MSDAVAFGVRCHAGWVVVVAVTGSAQRPVVRNRRRFELLGGSLPRQPYHAVAEAGQPQSVIEQVAAAALVSASAALTTMGKAAVLALVAPERRIPDNLDEVLASDALLHAAEGDLYERAIATAATDLGLPVHRLAPKAITVCAAVDGLGRTLGPRPGRKTTSSRPSPRWPLSVHTKEGGDDSPVTPRVAVDRSLDPPMVRARPPDGPVGQHG